MMTMTNAMSWYAIYTNYKGEATLNRTILTLNKQFNLGYETFLPTFLTADDGPQRAKNQVPLFERYLFVKHDERGFCRLKNLKGFSSYVCTGSLPAVIPEDQMKTIKHVAMQKAAAQCSPVDYKKGNQVVIKTGKFAGYVGTLLDNMENKDLIVEIKSLSLFVRLSLPVSDVDAKEGVCPCT
ncbi:MAG: hypothetical protein CL586_05985 [Alteromonadaceae bacterium]|nr:hypothetical protein [Alteromonadaceae bacterium]HCV04131.1 hypothetical protein [Pseudoalteromonas sp.]|tara:strand:- start:2402 stop:2947 length:546 start_codon:yes stop_codon:yes gene_type:complete